MTVPVTKDLSVILGGGVAAQEDGAQLSGVGAGYCVERAPAADAPGPRSDEGPGPAVMLMEKSGNAAQRANPRSRRRRDPVVVH